MTEILTRRHFLSTATMAGVAALTGCKLGPTTSVVTGDGRINALPGIPPTAAIEPGIHDLVVLGSDRYCWLLVPTNYDHSRSWPMTLFFRGAVTPARYYMDSFQSIADELGMLVLAPEATGRTWDLVLGGFGPDVEFINRSLHTAFQHVHVDPARIFTSGFSDGASYSLSLGLTNGDYFTRIAAYSPGFMQATAQRGHPGFFITHGNQDVVIPVQASQYIVEQLQSAGYEVDFREFDGPHAVSLALAKESWQWMLQGAGSPMTG